MKPATFPEEVLQLRIQVREIEPPIFRVIQVTSTRTFHLLHEIIQWSFAWKNYHIYEFQVGGARVILPSPDFPEQAGLHPRTTRLGDLLRETVRSFTYTYDFGDDWVHDIAIEKRLPPDPAVRYPICLAGARAGPPEDSGVPGGFEEFLAAWSDASHPRHREMRDWVGKHYDPERFDLALINDVLKMFRATTKKRRG
jgi:hypothetical protein